MEPLWLSVVKVLVLVNAVLGAVSYIVLAERRISAWIQDRLGPNRVGPQGLLQPIADGLKFIFKEDVIPAHVDKWLYILAPTLAMVPPLLALAAIPFGPRIQVRGHELLLAVADLDVGILFAFAVSSLSVYGIVLAGWASNSKYPILGGIRSAAQLISYEICMGLSVVGVFLIDGSLRLEDVVAAQGAKGLLSWHLVTQPIGCLIFLVAAFAETNRLPFDLPECETELVAGYHTEYSSMKFALFFLGEYCAMIVASGLFTALFLGGWNFPGQPALAPALAGVVGLGAFCAKMAVVLFFYMWVRWTLPRFRYDQLMALGWKVLLPIGLANVVATAAVKLLWS